MKARYIIPACACALGVFFGTFIHRRAPDYYPDRSYFQALGDLLCTCEFLSKQTQSFASNRWWSYSMLTMTSKFVAQFKKPPSNITIHEVKFDDFDSVLLIPDEFKKRNKPGPLIVFFHGGGWVFGSTASYMNVLVSTAKETGFAVMATEYRLAPTHPFPIPFEDCLHSVLSVMKDANKYNVDPSQIVIAGDSAGGNLALSVTLEIIKMHEKDESIYLPKMLALVYPVVQMVNFQLPSYKAYFNHTVCSEMVPKAWLSYLGFHDNLELASVMMNNAHIDYDDDEKQFQAECVDASLIPSEYTIANIEEYPEPYPYSSIEVELEWKNKIKKMAFDPRIAPLMSSDEVLSKLMRTHIMISNYDQLRDEGLILAKRLEKIGVDVTLQFLPDSPHATLNIGALVKSSYHNTQNSIFNQHIKSYIERN